MTGTAASEPKLNIPEWSVSELSAALKKTVEDSFGYVRVRGEVSGYRGPHSSGHCYFSLKDESARIEAVIWKGVFGRLRFKPAEGLEVVATGRLTTYPGSSKYQIVIESLEPAGVGALMALLEERKKKLAAEGLFDEARKQLLPYLPEVIGVVTSPTGAVIRDILHRLADRFPRRVLVWPVRVQGEGAAQEVASAIRGFNALPEHGALPRPDLIIVARGGGSIEDLWAFNEEIVVRAAAESLVPLIAAVGHETDVTLIDFAADRRAPTPTAAAEMAVPVRGELLAEVADFSRRQMGAWLRGIEARRAELRSAGRALQRPEQIFEVRRQQLDALAERLPKALRGSARVHQITLSRVASRLIPQLLHGNVSRRRDRFNASSARLASALRANLQSQRSLIDQRRERVQTLFGRAERAAKNLLSLRKTHIERTGRVLAALSYRGVLERGFALVRDQAGRPVRAAAAVSAGMQLGIEFADGRVAAVATGGGADPAPPKAGPKRERGTGQPSLFDRPR